MITLNPINTSLHRPEWGPVPMFGRLEERLIYTFSGKTAIHLLLNYMKREGYLPNKMSKIMVPLWMGQWIYMTISKHCLYTPSVWYEKGEFGPKDLQALWVWHQWGFPQKMHLINAFAEEHKLFIIEDCAHALASIYKGKQVGTWGEFAIFSFAKFYACVAGGALYFRDVDDYCAVKQNLPPDNRTLANEMFVERQAYDMGELESYKVDQHYAAYDQVVSPVLYALGLARRQFADGAMLRRYKVYNIYKKELADYDVFTMDDVTPWAVPCFVGWQQLGSLTVKLQKAGIATGPRRFDVNRNMLNPRWEMCIPLPCHHQLTDNDLDKIIDIIKGRA